MANRRMFSKTITNSSRFLMMSLTAQALYFHLGMNADDDGFCEHFAVMRMVEAKPDDLKVLQAKGLVKVFDERVLVVLDWKENNYLRIDRYTPSKYLEEYKEELAKIGIPEVHHRLPQDRLGKDRLEIHSAAEPREYVLEEGKPEKAQRTNLQGFSTFWEKYPKKQDKARASAVWRKLSQADRDRALTDLDTRRWADPTYIPLPKNYLEGRRWEDEQVTIKTHVF